MAFSNIRNKQKDSGFTIVELLVVIVVIGILAAITIVSYTGVTARARGTKAISNAKSVVSVANIYNTDPANSGFPATPTLLTGYTTMTKIPSGLTVQAGGAAVLTGATGDEDRILYMPNATNTGACIGYWDFASSGATVKYMYAGNATAGLLNQATPTCT